MYLHFLSGSGPIAPFKKKKKRKKVFVVFSLHCFVTDFFFSHCLENQLENHLCPSLKFYPKMSLDSISTITS